MGNSKKDSYQINEARIFGEKLKLLRKKSSYTIEEICELSGVLYTTYRRYERGKTEPGAFTIARLSKSFGIDSNYFISHAETPMERFEKLWEDNIDKINLGALEKNLDWRTKKMYIDFSRII